MQCVTTLGGIGLNPSNLRLVDLYWVLFALPATTQCMVERRPAIVYTNYSVVLVSELWLYCDNTGMYLVSITLPAFTQTEF